MRFTRMKNDHILISSNNKMKIDGWNLYIDTVDYKLHKVWYDSVLSLPTFPHRLA